MRPTPRRVAPTTPPPARAARRAPLCALLALALASAATPGNDPLPPIVFAARNPPPARLAGAIPGLGPDHRTLATGGHLMIREPGGAVRELLPAGACFDVSDPCVSPDAKRVAFAATPAPDSAWRITIASLAGATPAAPVTVTRPAAAPGEPRADDFDPCWVDDSTLCFASTRYPQRAQYGDLAVSNLFVVRLPDGEPRRITSERNGAEEPAFDPTRGRILFARWWHNRYLASDEPPGVTTDPAQALPGDTVSLWHAMEIAPDGDGERVACGAPASRLGAMAYQPAPLADGSIVAVYAANPGLSPFPGGTGLQRFAPRGGPGRRLIGVVAERDARAGYGSPSGLAPASACSPAGLPDGRIVFSYDPGGRGDFGLYVMRADGSGLARLLDLPGTLELDAAPVVAWRSAPPAASLPRAALPERPFTTLEQALGSPLRFRFVNRDVYARPPAGSGMPEGPPASPGARIRFYATLSRPAAEGGDTLALVREAPVGAHGRVDEAGLPAGLPMFEQLVDREGRVLRSAHGAAHVAGLNAGPPGGEVRCVGCHVGHSTRLRPGR